MGKEVVVRVTLGNNQHRSPCKSILISFVKLILPCGLGEKLNPTSAENKSKVLKVAVSLPGVHEVGLKGDNKDELVVKGNEELDPVILTKKLREKIASADILTVGPEKKKEEKKPDEPAVMYLNRYCGPPPMQLMDISEPTPSCVIF